MKIEGVEPGLVEYLEIYDDIYDALNQWILQVVRMKLPRNNVDMTPYNEQIYNLKREIDNYLSVKMKSD